MYLELLTVALKNKYDTEFRSGVHVSDLNLCLRKAVFRRLYPKATTMLELNFYTSGRAIHDAIQVLARSYSNPDQPNVLMELRKELDKIGVERTSRLYEIISNIEEVRMRNEVGRFEIEKEIVYRDIVGHIDLYDRVKQIPIECKTYRSSKIDNPKPHHVEQLKSYLAMTGSDTGILLYQLLLNFQDKPFTEFEIETNAEERGRYLRWLQRGSETFSNAINKRDPKLAPSVWDDLTLNWLCKSCPYREPCAKLEFDNGKT